MAIVDIAIAAVLLLFMLLGLKKGFVSGLFGLIGSLVSLVAAILLAGWFADTIYNWFGIGQAIDGWATGYIQGALPGAEFNQPLVTNDEVVSLLGPAMETLGLPGFISNPISSALSSSLQVVGEKSLAELIGALMGRVLLIIISIVVLYVLIRIVIRLIEALFNKLIKSSRLLGGVNRALGLVVGAVKGAIFVLIVFSVGFFFVDTAQDGFLLEVKEDINKSTIGKFVYDENPVVKYIDFDNILKGILGGEEEKAAPEDENAGENEDAGGENDEENGEGAGGE